MLIARSSIYIDLTYTHLLCACVLITQSVIVCLHVILLLIRCNIYTHLYLVYLAA